LVSEVNGTESGARQAAMVKNIEATVYIDRIRELAGGITTSGPGRGRGPKPRLGMALGSLGALPEDLTSLASLYRTRDSHLRTCLRSLGAPPTLRGRRLVIFLCGVFPSSPAPVRLGPDRGVTSRGDFDCRAVDLAHLCDAHFC
jgi:hypothetical protein